MRHPVATIVRSLASVAVRLMGAERSVPDARDVGPSACGTVAIAPLRFRPPAVAPGRHAALRLRAQNGTEEAHSAGLIWTGRFSGVTGGIPPGCPAVDRLAEPAGADRAALAEQAATFRIVATAAP